MASYLLHGTLFVSIYEASDLEDQSRLTGGAPKFFRKLVEKVEDAVGLGKGASELYCTVNLGDHATMGRTRVIRDAPVNPVWNEDFHIYCAHSVDYLTISVKNDNTIGAEVLGTARVAATDLLTEQAVEGWYDLCEDKGKGDPVGSARLRFRLCFTEATHDEHWGAGVRGRGEGHPFRGVPYTYFPQRAGCRVTLYQDAHVHDEFAPDWQLEGGLTVSPGRCWEDVFAAIHGARHLIYITGWSVYAEITLVRDPARPVEGDQGLTLGELLKKKAEEGVRVNLLVWDDRTSNSLRKDGLMATHDQDTEAYFEGSPVNCVLCPRNPDESLSFLQESQIRLMFTHHQKTVIVDAPPIGSGGDEEDGGERRIVSFVGGIDLCDGRYDTPQHPLFRTLGTVHAADFHQPNFEGASVEAGGPREPWHDIHSRVEGPVAWDVLYNFEQRWRKQGKGEDLLLPLQDVPGLGPPTEVTHPDDDPDAWSVQLFRSIDAGAASGFPDNPDDAAAAGLMSGKDNTVDRSIQDAYIQAIRRAQHFIYIENQYFLGSSASWPRDKDAEALHLIPIELALKIASKIEAGERFAVYVVVPMWPEGVPESASVQAILDWMHTTQEMMYSHVAQALQARGVEDQGPRDYLTFFCLGNREAPSEADPTPSSQPEPDTDYARAQAARRFMIYVHSKMMIVDDEYIIVGSANINQRSMDGARDSEIAIGAHQPHRLADASSLPRAAVHGFRVSLWYEHLGVLDDLFADPASLACVRRVNEIADGLLEQYTGDEVVDLPGHLLSFPVIVTNDGAVTEKPGLEFFPDTKAAVKGEKSAVLPPILTT